MVQNVSIPLDETRENCWSRSEKGFADIPHDAISQPSISNLNKFQVCPLPARTSEPLIDLLKQPPTPIQAALMSCGLDVADFVLIYSSPDGTENPVVLSSTGLRNYANRIINEQVCSTYTRSVLHYRNEMVVQPLGTAQFDAVAETRHDDLWDSQMLSPSEYPLQRLSDAKSEESDDGQSPRSRKRARVQMRRQYLGSVESAATTPAPKTQPLTIGNDADVESFYFIRFKDMQQSSCKVMGKAFVKLVEPKKQTHHPYTGGNDKAPSWWPATKGDNAVRHKEPDHLLKPERINLLVHILKMIIEPSERQNPTVRKLGLNVRKLEETTMEVMSNWFNDKDHPENLQKRKYLREIFRVAKIQERHKRGEVDGSTTIPVMCGSEGRTLEGSDDEGDEIAYTDGEPEPEEALYTAVAGVTSPERIVSPSLLHPTHQAETEIRLPTRSIRPHTPRVAVSGPATAYDAHVYRLDSNPYPSAPQTIPNLQDACRRTYSQWQSPIINASTSNNMYYGPPPPNTMAYLPPLQQQQQQQQPMHSPQHSFDGLHSIQPLAPSGVMNSRVFEGSQALAGQQCLRPSSHPPSMPYPAPSSYTFDPVSGTYGSSEHDVKQEQHQHR
ncbi:hypothetical protein BGHDH14_bgh05952 [Blumeria hordei DH14]|uniref:Subtelomeric hrmA-associated cluster protein AFUB-079030/YDR124W-like helical bundle domain-containing protein n=1 Tax=Blumeria graminis f. sp. hordei (strain DH14) TaxID=546991 RepID=N1J7S3_BLUG1|nr:hypothetical protein BGHDH14_bgh05952 [Blumeria hordei DH14]